MKLYELRPRRAAWRRSSFCASGECAVVAHQDGKILVRCSRAPRIIVTYTPEEFRALRRSFQAGEFDDLAEDVRADLAGGSAEATVAASARGTGPPGTQTAGGRPSTLAGPAGPCAPIPLTDTGTCRIRRRRPLVGYGHQGEQLERQPRPLLAVRSALVLLLASLSAIGAGWLVYAAHHSFALAVLGGAAAFAAAVPLFNIMID